MTSTSTRHGDDAWWLIGSTFLTLVGTMLLLTFIGDALRDAFDTRKS